MGIGEFHERPLFLLFLLLPRDGLDHNILDAVAPECESDARFLLAFFHILGIGGRYDRTLHKSATSTQITMAVGDEACYTAQFRAHRGFVLVAVQCHVQPCLADRETERLKPVAGNDLAVLCKGLSERDQDRDDRDRCNLQPGQD